MNCLRIMICGLLFLSINSIYAHEDTAVLRVKSHLYDIGTAINNVNVPVLGKLGNILPFAVTSFCLQQFPEQTILAITGYFLYLASKNERIYKSLEKYNFFKKSSTKKITRNQGVHLEEGFFVFDGDDLSDAEEQEESEDELLFESDDFSEDKQVRRKVGSFL